jgi:hypothetical protein
MNNHVKAAEQTSAWLKQNGISPKQFEDWSLPTYLLQAQLIAQNLLKHHANLLGQNEAASLNNFLRAMGNGNTRRKLTQAQANRVMNIGTATNRKLFKQYRQLNRR